MFELRNYIELGDFNMSSIVYKIPTKGISKLVLLSDVQDYGWTV